MHLAGEILLTKECGRGVSDTADRNEEVQITVERKLSFQTTQREEGRSETKRNVTHVPDSTVECFLIT